MATEGPLTDPWGTVLPEKVRIDILEMFSDVDLSEFQVYRDANKYPEGCELTLRVGFDYNRTIKVTIWGDAFKNLQTLILATMGMDDCDEIT